MQLLPRLPKNWSGKLDRKECERLAVELFGAG
jgi:hypothetical protein